MKATVALNNRSAVSPREALALATFLTVLPGVAAEKPVETQEEDKKKPTDEGEVLPELVVDAEKATPYNPQRVASPKFTAPLVNTPQSISAIPKEVFNQQGAQSLADVLRNVPGITFLAGEGGNPTSGDSQFRMRGFDAANSLFIDGVRDGGQYERDIYNIEQVDVARGPAGADVGRSTAAGYINLSTKTPKLERFVSGTSSIGFDDTDADPIFRNTLDYNQPLTLGSFPGSAFRLNALFQEGGVTGRELAESNRWAIAPSFAIGLDTDTRVFFAYQHLEQNNLPDYGLVRGALPGSANGGGGSYDPALPPVSQDTSYGSKYAFEDVVNDTLLFRLERDLNPNLTFMNQARLSFTDRLAMVVAPTNYSTDTGLVNRNFTANDRENLSFSNITNLTSRFDTGSVAHTLSTTLEFTHEEVDTVGYTRETPPGVDLVDPDHSLPLVFPARSGAATSSTVDTVSLSVFDTAELNEYFQLTGGFRAEYYNLDYFSRPASTSTADPTDIEHDDFLMNWKLGLVHKPVENGSVYVSYAYSEQNPGTNLNMSASETGTGADNINSDPQESINYEIGTKWNFMDDKLSTTLAVFRTEQKNIGIATDAVTGDVVQTGDQTVQGVEAGISGSITENWLVYAAVSYAHSENSNPSPTATNDGAELDWTPELSGSLWTTYRLPFGLTVGGGARYTDGGSTVRLGNGSNIQGIDPYWVFDAMASYPVTDNVTVRLNVNNLFDEDYMGSVNNNGNRYRPGAPRSFLISADWKF